MGEAVIMRMVERLLITTAGAFCIFLGYRLIMAGVVRVGSTEWRGFGTRLKLIKASPGVLFCLLGAVILLNATHTSVSIQSGTPVNHAEEDAPSTNPPIVVAQSFLGVIDTREWDESIAAVNLAIEMLPKDSDKAPKAALDSLRQRLLRAAFGKPDYEFFMKYQEGDLDSLDGEELAKWRTLYRRATASANNSERKE